MNFLDYGKYEEEYKQINQTILDGNVMNTSLIIIIQTSITFLQRSKEKDIKHKGTKMR